jgi:long-chain fatty acid transport protein
MRFQSCCHYLGIIIFLAICNSASAGGVWLYEAASPEMGTASAGRNVIADSASTASFNPAGMTRLEQNELMVGIQPMYIKARFDIDEGSGAGGGNGGNAGGLVPAAAFFYVHELNDDLKLGITTGSYLGLGLDYGSDWGGRYFVTEAELLTIMTEFNLGYRVNEKLSVGGGVNVVYSTLDQKMAWSNNPVFLPGSRADGEIKLDDSDTAFGFNLGMMYEFTHETRLGLVYRAEVDIEFEDALSTSGLVGLPGQLLGDAEVDLDMTLPQALSLSLFHQLDKQWAIVGSLGWQEWSEFGKTDLILGDGTGQKIDRNFDDTWNVALGAHYQYSDDWKLMAGISYDSSPVSKKDRTIDLPLDRQIRYAFGAQYKYSNTMTISAAYELLDAGSAKVDQSGIPRQGTLNGEFDENYIHIININASWKF